MKGLIQLCYRKIIDASSEKVWDKYVFEDTWMEFFMQAQTYIQEGRYQTFQEISDNVAAAGNMTYMVSTAAINYIRHLKFRIVCWKRGIVCHYGIWKR